MASINFRKRSAIYPLDARTERYRNSFLPYCISQWNNLDSRLRNHPSIAPFKRVILDFIRPNPTPYFKTNRLSGFVFLTRLRVGIPRKTIFPRSWNIIECSKRPRKYHLSINFLALKKDRISHHQKVQNKNFSVTSKYHLSINFLALKKDRISNHRKVQNKNFPVISKHHICQLFGSRKDRICHFRKG